MSKYEDLGTREKIIRQATELFMTKGTYNVSLREIAEMVGLTTPALYRHFKSLDDLIYEACKFWVLESKKFNRNEERGLESARWQLDNYIERHIDYSYKHRSHFSMLFSVYYRSMSSPQMLSLYQEIKAGAVAKILYILQLGNIDGSWKVKDVNGFAESIHSLVIAEVFKILIHPKEESREDRKDRVLKLIHTLLKNAHSDKS